MSTPSKFIERRRLRVLEVLRAGGSRREAARAVGIDPATLTRWIAKGRTAHPEGRWHAFYEDVRAAEVGSRQAAWEANPFLAWRFLELTEPGFRRPDPEPIKVEVVHGPTLEGDSA